MTSNDWNPRFVAFAKSKGTTPEEITKGRGTNVEFMCWISAKRREFKQAHPEAFLHDTIIDGKAFDAFIGA